MKALSSSASAASLSAFLRRFAWVLVWLAARPATAGQRTVFNDDRPETKALEFWRITHDPSTRHHTVYHHQDPFSASGRYLLYVVGQDDPARRRPDEPEQVVAVYDLAEDREVWRSTTAAHWPLWANRTDTLYFADGSKGRRQNVWQVDIPSGRTTKICDDARGSVTGITPNDDRLFWTLNKVYAVRTQPGSQSEVHWQHPEAPVVSSSLVCHNPVHPVYNVRQNPPVRPGQPFRWTRSYPARMLVDDDGRALGPAMAAHEQGHGAWRGDGEYLIVGDGFLRGRPWNEPFPSALLAYSNSKAHDPSPCGRSGQWTCTTDGINDCLKRFDWRTTDTTLIAYACSIIHQEEGNNRDLSGAYDSDAFGSPDGTKIVFSTNYQLDQFPATQVVAARDGRIEVLSAAGFPPEGLLSIGVGVVAYESRTDNAFLGCTGGALGSRYFPKLVSAGFTVSDFRGRADMTAANPMAAQYSTDVYLAVVRLPDAPVLAVDGPGLVLYPGRNHRETRGYEVRVDGVAVGEALWDGQAVLDLPAGRAVQAVAVEWSGLRSAPCAPATPVGAAARLRLGERPAGFDEPARTWFAVAGPGGTATPLATDARPEGLAQALAEVRDREGLLLARERYALGQLVSRDELTPEGHATLTQEYREGRLWRRTIRDAAGAVVRVETLDDKGRLASIAGGTTEEHPGTENRKVTLEEYRDGEPWRRVLQTAAGEVIQLSEDGNWPR